ncbi:peptidylprolyl isomerase [Sphingomonas panacisoli]|uniref:Peptidyl-prolyl cis-trans isomerase n=1 Tax=Sphingomonas panacisoli TaxID=1813879 RepID=A0A5B8LJQ8_9SPHN|nr:peptidylprolyl isomerase [Sphingomonas panacisoli]QDZ08468.1 peptidylprolyl isomerase [Sphingomonas panacisoli]
MRFLLGLIATMCLAVTGNPSMAAKKKTAAAVAPTEQRIAPPALTDKENLLYLDLSTGGRVVVRLYPNVAPKMVERIKILTRQHFYDGLKFHRVIEGFMAQTGDPKGDGTGGSTLPDLPAEFNWMPHVRGAVSAAREGAAPDADAAAKKKAEDSANSQFFIVLDPKLVLDKKYTVFGRVISGMEYVDTVERGEPPANPSTIVHAYIAADNPPAYAPAPPPPPLAALAPAPTPTPAAKPVPAKPVAKKPAAKK